MSETLLDRIEAATRSLIEENLRGQGIIVARTYALISEAMSLGYKRDNIHEAMKKGGLTLTESSFVNALHRAKVAIENGKLNVPVFKTVQTTTTQVKEVVTPIEDTASQKMVTVEKSETNENTSSATHLADTLKESVTVAQKDYSKIALQKLKQGNRSL